MHKWSAGGISSNLLAPSRMGHPIWPQDSWQNQVLGTYRRPRDWPKWSLSLLDASCSKGWKPRQKMDTVSWLKESTACPFCQHYNWWYKNKKHFLTDNLLKWYRSISSIWLTKQQNTTSLQWYLLCFSWAKVYKIQIQNKTKVNQKTFIIASPRLYPCVHCFYTFIVCGFLQLDPFFSLF